MVAMILNYKVLVCFQLSITTFCTTFAYVSHGKLGITPHKSKGKIDLILKKIQL